MRQDRSNMPSLSLKKQCHGQANHGNELGRLRADLETEKSRRQQALWHFSVELRHLREDAECELQKALKELTSRPACQKASLRHNSKHPDRLIEKVHTRDIIGDNTKDGKSWRGIVCQGNSKIYHKLEQLLLRLYEKINVEQAVCNLHDREELELEKAFFLCHLLEAHSRLLQGKQSHSFKGLLRKPSQRHKGNLCCPGPPQSSPRSLSPSCRSTSPSLQEKPRQEWPKAPSGGNAVTADHLSNALLGDTCCSSPPETSPHADSDSQLSSHSKSSGLEKSAPTKWLDKNMEGNGTDYGFLVRQNSELLRALEELEKNCTALREENGLLRKSSAPETEEKVRRLRRKNTELAVLAKRLEERARKLQEANLKVVNAPSLLRPGSAEQYKRAFARQRARDLARHADTLLSKDKEIAALQQECRNLEARLGTAKDSPLPSDRLEFERLLRESQREVLRLQRQLSVTSSSSRDQQEPDPARAPDPGGDPDPARAPGLGCSDVPEEARYTHREKWDEQVASETPRVALDEAPPRCEETPREEEESGPQVTPQRGPSPTPGRQEDPKEEQRLQFLECELCKKRKECENLEHEVKKRQKRCLDLECELCKKRKECENLEHEVKKRQKRCLDLVRRAQLLDQTRAANEDLREDLSEVTAHRNSVLEENQRLRAKLENLEQVLKHMREVAERRQQLELEHEQALAILKFKQDEIKRLQRAQLFAKREHEGVVQMLENTLDCMQSKVRDLEDKCRSQSEQFGLLSQELERFRLQASKVDLASTSLLANPNLSVLTNGVGLTTDRDVAAALRMGATPHAAGLSRVERSPATKHRELPTISVSKSGSTSSKSETAHLTPKSDSHLSPHKSSPTHEVDTASEVEELDIDAAPAPFTASRGAAKLQVFIARYSYNPYDGPNDNPEVELPLSAGEYIYVYGDMDDDGFYEGELMDGRRGLVPSNFVERISDDDVTAAQHAETVDMSHNSLLDGSLHSASHQQQHLRTGRNASERTETPASSGPATPPAAPAPAAAPAPLTNGLDLDLDEVGVDIVPYPRKLTLIKQLAKSIVIGWDPPLVPAGWGNVWSYNVYVDQELRINVPFGAQTKAVLERLDVTLKAYRVSVQSLTERGLSDQLQCSMLVGRDVCVAPTQLRVDRISATAANLTWLPSNSNYVHVVSLNEEERELVKASCYSLCLCNLMPSLQYTVKVEARPHCTPWELPVERREHRSATITFSTLMAGPPDAPLGVQLEQGPSPGIALINWLPVTIDAAGTSNGVRVTGYTIYADRKKVLEVSSPTAGSALLGPSQISVLQVALELTVRTKSAHGESCDSLPVNVPAKLAAIMTGPAAALPVVPALPCASLLYPRPPISYGMSAAKVSMLPCAMPPRDTVGLAVEAPANTPLAHHHHPEALLSSASYAEAWAHPAAAAALVPAASTMAPVVNATSPTSLVQKPATPLQIPPSPAPLAPVVPPVAAPVAPAPDVPIASAACAMQEQRRDAASPGTMRPFPSIAEFLEDPSAKLKIPERIPSPPKAPMSDLLNPQDTHPLRHRNPSPLESEGEEETENTRLVSIDEFLRQEPEYDRRQQSFGIEPQSDYHAENSRTDLSDILEEEEEEDYYSDHLVEGQSRGYTLAACRLSRPEPPDSDEEVLEGILRLPPQAPQSKELFSIPELTEEEDNGQEESLAHRRHRRSTYPHPRDAEQVHHSPRHHNVHPPQLNANPCSHPQHHHHHHHHHLGSDPQASAKEPSPRHGALQVRPKAQQRVHYADAVDTAAYPEDDDASLYEGPSSRRVAPPQATPYGRERAVSKAGSLGDRLRREAMRRSQVAAPPGCGFAPPGAYMVSKTVRTLRSPTGHGTEIDVEYGADDNEEPGDYGQGEVVMDQMSSEWWVERPQGDFGRILHGPRGPKAEPQAYAALGQQPRDTGRIPPVEAGAATREEQTTCLQARQPKGVVESQKIIGENDVRVFVALFPYNPATMSPNPDAAEEELPFSEGQIIKVYGDKDADGFYRGESGGRHGYVPCNMVSEIQVEDEETRQQLLLQGFLTTEASMEKIDPSHSSAATGNPTPGARRMVAIFDYDPRESSPNTDIEAELTFSAGDIIHVFGDMDDDGFFYGDLNGHQGLVPSNFLQALPDEAPVGPPPAQPAPEPKREPQKQKRTVHFET